MICCCRWPCEVHLRFVDCPCSDAVRRGAKFDRHWGHTHSQIVVIYIIIFIIIMIYVIIFISVIYMYIYYNDISYDICIERAG